VKSDTIGAVGADWAKRARRGGRSQMILIIHFRASSAPEQCHLPIYVADLAHARRSLQGMVAFRE
jgi:hypothetical protein